MQVLGIFHGTILCHGKHSVNASFNPVLSTWQVRMGRSLGLDDFAIGGAVLEIIEQKDGLQGVFRYRTTCFFRKKAGFYVEDFALGI